jgi:hypothetical protein
MNNEPWSDDAVERLARLIRDIESCEAEELDVLLTDFLCAAWPTLTAQDH